jgi:hypothetical protein
MVEPGYRGRFFELFLLFNVKLLRPVSFNSCTRHAARESAPTTRKLGHLVRKLMHEPCACADLSGAQIFLLGSGSCRASWLCHVVSTCVSCLIRLATPESPLFLLVLGQVCGGLDRGRHRVRPARPLLRFWGDCCHPQSGCQGLCLHHLHLQACLCRHT